MKDKKIIVIGLDGANKTTAQLLGLEKYKLHSFISTIPPYTPPAWNSILTGVTPAKHGIIGWQKVDIKNNSVTFFTSKDVKYPRLSKILEKSNLKSTLINLPMTYPFSGVVTKQKKTVIVSDWAAPKQAIYPKEIEKKYKEYLIEPPHNWATEYNKKEYASKVYEYTKTRMNLYYDLLEKKDWNLYFIVFSEIDWFSHVYPQILEKRETRLVSHTFNLIGKFVKYAKTIADVVLIISDHGFEVKKEIFYVNEALARNGFIKYNRIKSKTLTMIKNIMPENVLKKIASGANISTSILTYIAQNADAFMVEPASWSIYVRNENRLGGIKDVLKTYGELSKIIESTKVYDEVCIDNLPQLFVIPNKGVELSHELKGVIKEETYKGGHEIHGIFSAYGMNIKEDIDFKQIPTVYDIAPTILHIFGLPIPNYMNGRVLMEIFEDNSEFSKRKPKYVDPSHYEKNQKDEKLKDIIKNLKLEGKI